MIQGLLLPGNGGRKDFPNRLFPPREGTHLLEESLRESISINIIIQCYFFKKDILFIKLVRHGRGKRENQSENGFRALFTDYSYKDKFPWNYVPGVLSISQILPVNRKS